MSTNHSLRKQHSCAFCKRRSISWVTGCLSRRWLCTKSGTAYGWAKDGTLPAFKVGGTLRLERADMAKWVAQRKRASQQEGEER